MNSKNLDKYFTWLPVVNTTEQRHQKDSSTQNILYSNKIRESTKQLNKYLQTHRPKCYSDFVQCKKKILSQITDNADVTNNIDLSVNEYKAYYDSFNVTSAFNSVQVPDDLFVWSFIEKKGLKKESVDPQRESIWEPAIDIKIDGNHEQCDNENKYNVSLKAAGALLIKKEQKKYLRKSSYNTRSSTSFKNSVNNNTSCTNKLTETPTNFVEEINDSDTKVFRNPKLKNVRKNLKCAIDNVSSQVSESSEANLSDEFIPEDFQAESTQIFSDTFRDANVKSCRTTRKAHKLSPNDAVNQPRDSGIEEDSRDENTTHQNIENEKGNKTKQDNLSSNNSEKRNIPKQCLKIIGDETLKKKYIIIAKDNRLLQPIIEEKYVPLPESNVESNNCSKHESDEDSESDFKSIESDDNKEEYDGEEKTNESSDEYYDVHDKHNSLSSEDENVSSPKKCMVDNPTDVDSDSQNSKHHHQRTKNQLKESTSPWIAKQYNDLKRLRLLESSQDDSEIESNKKDESDTIAKQKVLMKNKKTSKKLINKIEKSSKQNTTKSNNKKWYINDKLIKNSDSEMNEPQVSYENFDENEIINSNSTKGVNDKNASLSNKKEKFIKNSDYSNFKLDSDNEENIPDPNIADSHKFLQENKKLKQRKKKQSTNRSDSHDREHSYERTQYDLKDTKNNKDSSQSIKDEDSNENLHQNYVENDAIPDLHVRKSTKEKTKLDYDNSDDRKEVLSALCSKHNSSCQNASVLSIDNIVKSNQVKESSLKNEIYTSFNNEKESEDENTISKIQRKKLQNLKKMDLMASDVSSGSERESEPSHQNEKSNKKVDVIDDLEMKETVLPFKEIQSDEGYKEDDCLPTLYTQKKRQQMKRLIFDGSSESEDSEADTVSMNKHKSQFIKPEIAKEQGFEEKSGERRTKSDEESDEEDNKNKKLQIFKKYPMVSEESNVSEMEQEDVDSQSEKESSCHKNEKIIEKSYESNEIGTNVQETKVLKQPYNENQSDESDKEDKVIPTRHVQEKLKQMKRLNFDDPSESSESQDSEIEIVSMNKHKSQFIKTEVVKKQSFEEKSGDRRTKSDEESDEEDNKNKKLQIFKKYPMASEESNVSEMEHEDVDSQGEESSCYKNEKIIEKSYESNEIGTNLQETKVLKQPYNENQSDESDKEDKVIPTRHVQEKLKQMKKLNFDDPSESSESQDSETEIVSMNKHKSQFIKTEVAKKQSFEEKSGECKASSDEENDEEDLSKNEINHLQKMKKMDLMAIDESEDSDKDVISKSRRILPHEEMKSADSEDDDKAPDTAVFQEKNKLYTMSRNIDSNKDSDSVHYDSDNVDIKEHKLINPQDLKNSNLLEQFNESNITSFSMSENDGKTETFFDRKDNNDSENDEDEEIDSIVPVEVTKRMQQLKRLNLYENDDSSDSDESIKNNRNNETVSQKPSNVSRKELDESKEDVEDNIANEKTLDKVDETNNNVIIPETQESKDYVSDDIQSQEMFSSLEHFSESLNQIPPTPQLVPNKSTSTEPNREKITRIDELVEQEELIKIDLEPTMTLNDVSDDEEIFVIEVPKNVFDKELIGKKLVVTKSTLSIGDSHYEVFKKDTEHIMSCVLNSKKRKLKTVNIRPLLSIVTRRKKNAEDFIENTETGNQHENLTVVKNQQFLREGVQESANEARYVEPTSMKKSKSKKKKLSQIDEPVSLSFSAIEESKMSTKISTKAKKNNSNNLIDVQKMGQDKSKASKASKRKLLYTSDHEINDVCSDATDDSFTNINNSFKKPKHSLKGTDSTDTSAKLVKNINRSELTLKNQNKENKTVSYPKNENNNEMDITEQSKSKSKSKKKSSKKGAHQETEEESQLESCKNSLEDDKEMFKNMFRESFLCNISTIEEEQQEQPVKNKAKKRKSPVAIVKPKRTRRKVEKPAEEPACVQIMKFINDAFKSNNETLNASISSNESRYGTLDIERIATKKNYSSSSSSDESEKKYPKPKFQIRDKSKEKEQTEPMTSTCSTNLLKKEVKDEKKKIKKIHFDE